MRSTKSQKVSSGNSLVIVCSTCFHPERGFPSGVVGMALLSRGSSLRKLRMPRGCRRPSLLRSDAQELNFWSLTCSRPSKISSTPLAMRTAFFPARQSKSTGRPSGSSASAFLKSAARRPMSQSFSETRKIFLWDKWKHDNKTEIWSITREQPGFTKCIFWPPLKMRITAVAMSSSSLDTSSSSTGWYCSTYAVTLFLKSSKASSLSVLFL
mmetsp:Transcript_14278/g.41197  ORF Transcript_14278/g.41197 Transcript_14278/m.41197 type:complete len:211 (-) Transcript_14278:1116-1748(-)